MEIRKKRLLLMTGMLGFVSMIVLTSLIGNLGMAYFAIALESYLLLDVLLSACVPDYVEKMVRSRMAKAQYKNADKVLKTTFFYALITGICGSVFLFCFAEMICGKLFHAKEAALALKILAPAFCMNAVSAVLQGYFQGIGTAMPTLVSGILKQLLNLSFGALFGYMLFDYGKKAAALLHSEKFSFMYGAAGVATGFLLASVLILMFLLFIYLGAGRRMRRHSKEGMRLSEDGIDVLRQLLFMLLPAAAAGFLLRTGTFLGTAVYQSYHAEETASLASFGSFYGRYLSFAGLVTVLALVCCAGTETTVIHSLRKEEYKNAKNYLAGGMQSIWILTLFPAAVCFVLSPYFMEGEELSDAVKCMRHGFLLPVFLPMGIYFSHILMETGRQKKVLLSRFIAFCFFIAAAFLGGALLKGDLLLLVYALQTFAVVHCLVNGFFLLRETRCDPEWIRLFLLPFLAAGITGCCIFLLSKALLSLFGGLLTGLVCLLTGGFCYLILIFVFRCIREKDLYVLPGGMILRKVGIFLHLL